MKNTCLLAAFLFIGSCFAQENLNYQKPPQAILDLVDVPMAPSVRIDSKGEYMMLRYRDTYKSIAELSEPEMRLAGLRINPKTNIGSRTRYYNNIEVKKTTDLNSSKVDGLPLNPLLANFTYSPDQSLVSFTNTTESGVEVWLLDIAKAKATRLTDATVNANLGRPITWFKNNKALLVKMLPAQGSLLINTAEAVPTGPTVSISEGEKAQNRTYQDLLKNPNDERNFETLAISSIYKIGLNGEKEEWLPAAMYREVSFSPDGQYVLVSKIERPFSYIVPYYRFPFETSVYDQYGGLVQQVLQVPLAEVLPKGFMAVREGKRNMNWRKDQPATLVWVEALDGGDPENKVEFRDEVFQIAVPFTGQPKSLLKTMNRFNTILWGNDQAAIAYDYWWNNRNTKTYVFDPGNGSVAPKVISDRNYQDRYNDPGDFATVKNEFNERVLAIDKSKLYLSGEGFTEMGQFPFIDQFNLKTHSKTRLYQSDYSDKLETIYDVVDLKRGQFLVRVESQNEYPNYYIRDIKQNTPLIPLTSFENPFKSIEDVHKEVITYKREDGLELEGTLYLPLNYDQQKKEKVPMILWAYPREFKDKSSASQNTSNPNEFIYPYYGSPIYWVTQGYAVLDNAAFPIVGEGEEEPNDTFREQLVGNAKAAIDAVDNLGYIDRTRVGVGGHSYGAFMVANLLSHSTLFAAGIARSGAYNRTLTPFGFQSEERSYWDSPETYYTMSPFMHADKMKTPLLLIHGEADNNSGTYPLQSERYFNALKGLGATARLVMLPKESHGYRAKESVLHLLWEQDRWLDRYVKNRQSLEAADLVPND
ncbi:MAG: alpha/beta hydrolase family protein [Cyclobacteriaceae bacterium]